MSLNVMYEVGRLDPKFEYLNLFFAGFLFFFHRLRIECVVYTYVDPAAQEEIARLPRTAVENMTQLEFHVHEDCCILQFPSQTWVLHTAGVVTGCFEILGVDFLHPPPTASST